LDGETNLKPKLAIKQINQYFGGRSDEDIALL
jgi:magnesium-transporting ATPase (P-type)